jgi:pimeloyl-ACP methyl ester carboxylesterase
MPTVIRNDIALYFEESGSGPPFVFSHGLGGSVAQIKELIEGLPNVRLILFDNRGHGRTSGVGDPGQLNFAAMADDVAALLDHLAIPAAVVGGVSMGAGISLAFALKNPSRAKGLVLSRPAWLNQPRPPNLAVLQEITGMIEQFGRDRALDLFRKSDLFTSWEKTAPETAKSLTEVFLERRDSANLSTYRFIPESAPFRFFDELKTLSMPTLILTNRNDPLHPFTYGERLAAAIPGAHLHEFPSKSESLELHSRGFRELVGDFLNALLRESGN